MRYIIGLFVTATIVFMLGSLRVGAEIQNYESALWVALVLSVLNIVVRPILTLISLPITFMTLGLFLLVINAIIVLLAAQLVEGFQVFGFWGAVMFSTCLSLSQTLAFAPFEKDKVEN